MKSTERRRVLDGIALAETCDANGRRVGSHRLGNASEVLK